MKFSLAAILGFGISFLPDLNMILQALVLIVSLIAALIGLYRTTKK